MTDFERLAADSGAYSQPPGPDISKLLYGSAAAALLGALFSAFSTSDFIAHLDRQVHSIHCSFIPGASAQLGESGCKTVMMSPYSSLFRDSLWGGLPIALLALAVFAYLVAYSMMFAFAENKDRTKTTYLLAAWTLPVVMSGIYGIISSVYVGALCKLCVGIYVCSVVGWVCAFLAFRKTRVSGQLDTGAWLKWFGIGCAYVFALVAVFLIFRPTEIDPGKGCGSLVNPADTHEVLLDLHSGRGKVDAIAVLDPLCPACKGFESRVRASGLDDTLAMKTLLFPLDSACNWMVKESLHPGACAVSEAMLCQRDDGNGAVKILDWAFENQADLRDAAKKSDKPVRDRLLKNFPKLKGCLGSNKIKNKLGKSLRWAVANALPVMTPQLFVNETRVCDEDTDLGLEFTVEEMLQSSKAATAKGGQ